MSDTKNKIGRPTKMTPETIDKLEFAFSIGCTDIEACLHADITRTTLDNYQNANPEFLDRKWALKEKPVLMARMNVVHALQACDTDMSKWYLEKKKKDEFSGRQEVTGADGEELKGITVEFVAPKEKE